MRGSVYLYIALLALYGDIIKRFFPSAALGIVYLLAIFIMVLIFFQRRRKSASLSIDAKRLKYFVFMLIATYALQVVTSFDSPLGAGIGHFLYMAIPLSFIIVIQKYSPQFDLTKLAIIFLILMIPINIVGVIQYSVNPSFLISTAYSESGGVIERNFIVAGTFSRYPALFASADRYSAMALMQFFFSIMLLSENEQGGISRSRLLWVGFNLLSSFAALMIAGARSRILIAIVEISLLAIVSLVPLHKLSRNSVHTKIRRGKVFPVVLFAGIFIFFLIHAFGSANIPILQMLQQTFSERDIINRLDETRTESLIPDDISFFGRGLGTESQIPGKPGELGIRSIWIESGIFWGSLLILFFMGIVITLFKISFSALINGLGVLVVMSNLPSLLLIFGLLSGFTGVFELSTGMLLACAIAVAVRSPLAEKNSMESLNKSGLSNRRKAIQKFVRYP